MSIPGQVRRQNPNPEKMVLVVGIIFLLAGLIFMQLAPSDWWVLPAVLVTWGAGAILNFAAAFVRAALQKK